MRTATKEFTVYKYKELEQDAKYEAILRLNPTDIVLNEDLVESAREILTPEFTVHFDLSHTQGRGVCVTSNDNWINLKDFVENTDLDISSISKNELAELSFKVSLIGRYCHARSFTIDLEEGDLDLPKDIFNEIEYSIIGFLYEINIELEAKGDELVEFYESDENMIDLCEANEYEFLKDGSLF